MAHDVRERFERDAVGGYLDGSGQCRKYTWAIDDDVQVLPLKAISVQMQGGNQTELIERRWPQVVNGAPHIGDRRLGLRLQLDQQRVDRI